MSFPINALETKNGDPVPDPKSQLAGKVVALYFSSSWCPACQIFTPLLSVLHEEAQENNIDFEVIYVSSDHSAEESLEYRKGKHGEWYSIPFEQTAAYKIKYGVFAGKEQSTFSDTERRSGIPTLVIVDPTGKEMDLLDCDDNKVIQEIEGKGTAFLKRWEAFKW